MKIKKNTFWEGALLLISTVVIAIVTLNQGMSLLVLIFVAVPLSAWLVYRSLRMRFVQMEARQLRMLEKMQSHQESFIALNAALKPAFPIPELKEWSLTPHFGNILMNTIGIHKPKVILECGSGISTLVMAYCLARIGKGHVYALEHLEKYAEETRALLKLHGLESYATVFYADLIPHKIGAESWKWYDTSRIQELVSIDMLIVDGPPGQVSSLARYPAVPLLESKLNPAIVILLDDYDRTDEQMIVKLWGDKYGIIPVTEYHVERGVCELRKYSHSDERNA